MKISKERANHQETDKRVGKRCGICIHAQRLTASTNMLLKCETVDGVMKYGNCCDRFKLRQTAIPQWYLEQQAAMAEETGGQLDDQG